MDFFKLNDKEKLEQLTDLYNVKQLSVPQIAEMFNTYPNKIRREAIRLGISLRSKSEAQANALNTGRHAHPTKGKNHTPQSKEKIGEKMHKTWKSLTQSGKEHRSKLSKEQWDEMSELKKAEFRRKAGEAVRKASKDGSKLEQFLCAALKKQKYVVEYHKEHILENDRLHLDIFLPKDNIVIEVDGPSHFKPIWGENALAKNQRADMEKNGLLLSKGLVLIRVQQTQALSEIYKRKILALLLETLWAIKLKWPKKAGDRLIYIGVKNED